MCGIVGYAAVAPLPGLDADLLRRACRAMSHRGPDGEGIWTDEAAGFGHRRLAIIDLAGGAQPMADADDRFRITFNGEIYNYRELRAQLEAAGQRFLTASDTEVILGAFAAWGDRAAERLRGIFAFAIWDRRERRLTLCRDHLGVKPLFYHLRPGGIVFSSEMKGILEARDVPREPDGEALADYLALGYPLGEATLVRGVRRLRPGTVLTWRDGAVSERPFWDAADHALAAPGSRRDEHRLVEEYTAALEQAVAGQMVSDVPVGGFLSGGMDSSTVVYHMRRCGAAPLKTFSMGFAEASFSELGYARRVAGAFGTEHHDETVSPDLAGELPGLVRTFDEPLGDSSLLPTYCVSRLARRHVKVVLTGDGADECLAGYDTYVADALQRHYRRLPQALHAGLLLPLSRMVPPGRGKVGLGYKLRQFVAHAHEDLPRAHFGWRLLFEPPVREALLGGRAAGYDPREAYGRFFDEVRGAHPLQQCLCVDLKTWLANDILPKVDRASMAVGLEARVPFLDADLVALTLRLPPELKMRGLRRKVVLRKAMEGKLPGFVLGRRKSGFNSPVASWLRGPVRELAGGLLDGPSSLVDLGHPAVRRLWDDHQAGRADHGFPLWSLATLLLWERAVLGRPPGSSAEVREP